MKTKTCKKCIISKTIDMFHIQEGQVFNVRTICKECRNKYPVIVLPEGFKKCRGCNKIKNIEYYNKEKRGKFGVKSKCSDCTTKVQKDYRNENPEKVKTSRKKWNKNNRDIINKSNRNRYQNDIEYKIYHNLRSRLYKALKGTVKSAKTMELIGCSVEFLMKNVENKFYFEMTWENHGKYWELDHIHPAIHLI